MMAKGSDGQMSSQGLFLFLTGHTEQKGVHMKTQLELTREGKIFQQIKININ